MSNVVGELTDRQRVAMAGRVEECRVHGVEIVPWRNAHPWSTEFQEETRPGRGHQVSAVFVDGEHFVQITLDPYGAGELSIAAMRWLHNSADEECDCSECRRG